MFHTHTFFHRPIKFGTGQICWANFLTIVAALHGAPQEAVLSLIQRHIEALKMPCTQRSSNVSAHPVIINLLVHPSSYWRLLAAMILTLEAS